MADAHTLSEEYSEQVLPNTIFELIAAAFGIFGNSLVVLMYTKYVKDKSGSRYFIPVLAVVDLIGTVSNVTQFYLDNTMRYIYPSVFLCKTMHFLIIFTGEFSALMILAIALQRYLIICRQFGKQMSRKVCRIAIQFLFLTCAGYASPILKFNGLYKLRSFNVTSNLTVCSTDDGTNNSNSVIIPYLGVLLFLSFLNIFVVSVLYIPVIKTIYERFSPVRRHRAHIAPDYNIIASKETQIFSVGKNTNRKDSIQANEESNSTSRKDGSPEQKARKNISVMFLVIIIVYVVSYLTSLITHIHHFASTEEIKEIKGYKINIYVLCIRFQLLNHIANPYIYWIFDIKFRNELRRFCCSTIYRR